MLSYDLWRSALRSDPAVVGRSITLNNDRYRVVGIMPRGFQLIDSYVGLTLCYVAFSLPIVVWLMRDFFEAVPIEVESEPSEARIN